jgi:GNAT superfamily N-acetyltransferase
VTPKQTDSSGTVAIRAARSDELLLLIAIEQAAGESFRSLGMDLVADDDPGAVEELQPYAEEGRAFVSVDAADRPTGYLLVDNVDGAAHIEQVSVDPTHARQGIGRALIERAVAWARGQGLDSLTLTTYVDVPWNGPYYERLGFHYVTPDELTPRLRAIRDHERASGLDAWPRAAMRLTLRPAADR